MVTRAHACIHKRNLRYALTTTAFEISPLSFVRATMRDPHWYAAIEREFSALQPNRT